MKSPAPAPKIHASASLMLPCSDRIATRERRLALKNAIMTDMSKSTRHKKLIVDLSSGHPRRRRTALKKIINEQASTSSSSGQQAGQRHDSTRSVAACKLGNFLGNLIGELQACKEAQQPEEAEERETTEVQPEVWSENRKRIGLAHLEYAEDTAENSTAGAVEQALEEIVDDFDSELLKHQKEGPVSTSTFLTSFLKQDHADKLSQQFLDPDREWRKDQIVKLLAAFCTKCKLAIRNRRLLIKLFRVVFLMFPLNDLVRSSIPSASQLEMQVEEILDSFQEQLAHYCSGCCEPVKKQEACTTTGCRLANVTRKLIGREQRTVVCTVAIKPQIVELVQRNYLKIKAHLKSISAAKQSGVWTDVIHSAGERSLMGNIIHMATYLGPFEPSGPFMRLCLNRALKELSTLSHLFKVPMTRGTFVYVRVKVFCVVAGSIPDTPARANLFMFVHNASPLCCFKCFESGFRFAGKPIWLPTFDANKRLKTGEQFERLANLAERRTRTRKEEKRRPYIDVEDLSCLYRKNQKTVCGVVGRSSMLDVCSTEQLLTEVFHLLKQGLLKTIHSLQIGNPGKNQEKQEKHNLPHKDWSKSAHKIVIQNIVSKTILPTGVRCINDPYVPAKLNGEMLFNLYMSSWPFVLSECDQGKADTYWFTYLVILINRLMVQPQMVQADVDVLKMLLDWFRWSAPSIMGFGELGINIHNVSQHLADQIRKFLFMFDLDASVFESHIGEVKRTATFSNQEQIPPSFTKRYMELKSMCALTFDGTPFANQEETKSFMQSLYSRGAFHRDEKSQIPVPGKVIFVGKNDLLTFEKARLRSVGFKLTNGSLECFETFSFCGKTYASHNDYRLMGDTTLRSAVVYKKQSNSGSEICYGILLRIFLPAKDKCLCCGVRRWKIESPIWELFKHEPECSQMKHFKQELPRLKSFWFKIKNPSEYLDYDVIRADMVIGHAALCCLTSEKFFIADLCMRYVHN